MSGTTDKPVPCTSLLTRPSDPSTYDNDDNSFNPLLLFVT